MALRLGYESIEDWEIATDVETQAAQLAVAWIDRWGDEWKWLASEVRGAALIGAGAQGVDVPETAWAQPTDYEPTGEPANEEKKMDWGALTSALSSMAFGNRNK